MASNPISRAALTVLLALLWTAVPSRAWAEYQYCATRYMPQQQSQCFKTKGEAEQYIRVEPATPIGNSLLQVDEERQLSPGFFLASYKVKPAAPTFYADYYRADGPGGKGRGCTTDTPGVKTPNGETWCDDEASLALDINRYYDPPAVGNYSGGYYTSEPVGWGDHGEYIYVPRHLNTDDNRVYNAQTAPGVVNGWRVYKYDWYKCPALYHGSWWNPLLKWPLACFNEARAEITRRSTQYDSCCKDGNPTVASTGNKEYRETDFEWEGDSFVRNYNSIRDMSLQSGLTDSWAHSFSTRLIIRNGEPHTWLQADGYFDYPTWNSVAASYAFANRPGVVMIKEPDEVAAARGRWRISTGQRELLWFNESGRLSAFDRGGRVFTLEYCSAAEVQAMACAVEGDLRRVRSPSGRTLTFDYLANAVPGRIARISADGAIVVEYAYDGQGRLTHTSKGGPAAGEGTEYVYAEPSRLCRGADGGTIAGCDAGNFPNHLTGVVDENGQRFATYSYDDFGRATVSEHAGGVEKVTWTYSGSGSTTVTLPLGATKSYWFSTNEFRQPSSIAISATDGSIAGTSSAFWSDNRRQWSYDARGFKTEYAYNHTQQISRKEGIAPDGANTPSARTIQTDWNSFYSLPTERRTLDASGALVAKSLWTYNDRGQGLVVTQSEPATGEVRTTTTVYCEASDVTLGSCPLVGLIQSIDGPRTDVADITAYTYYAADHAACATAPADCAYRKGDLWKVANPLGQVVEYLRYDSAGRALSSKDPNGVVTDLEYTPRGWLAARKVRGADPNSETDDAITRYEYDLAGQVKKVIQPDGSFVRYQYDAAHRLTDIFDMAGNRIHYTLDAAGNRTKEDTQDANGALKRTLSRIYNQLGQLKTAKTAEGHPTGYTYDADGNGDVVTDALGRKTDSDYDPLGRLAKTLQDVGGINAKTEFKYDAQDRLVRVTDPKNLNTDYGYNGFGDQVRLSSPDTGVSTFTYDSAGNRKTATDARGITQTYSYDALNRVTGVSYPTSSLNVAYVYDSLPAVCAAGETFTQGRLTLMTDSSGSTQYCYDRFGNTTRKVQTTNGKVFTVRYGYTLAGQLSSLTYPDGAVVTYQRDAQGRISRVDAKRGSVGGTNEILLSQASYHPFGAVAGIAFGNGRTVSRLSDLDYRTSSINDSSADGLSFGLGYDVLGNINRLKPANAEISVLAYDYDALSRLSHVRDGLTGTTIESYGYDATGNRSSFTNAGGAQIYTYAIDSHRLLKVGSSSLRDYDANGNSKAINGKELVYDEANRLVEVRVGAAALQNYAYNGRGEQVHKYGSAIGSYLIYDESGRWLAAYGDNGEAIQQIIWMDSLPVGLWDKGGIQSRLHYIEADHLGAPRVVIDPVRNAAVWRWDLKGEVFGNSQPEEDADQDGTPFIFDMRFPGQLSDSVAGWNYNYYRNYDPATGRYIESDPIGLYGGFSTYSYVFGRPLQFVDPHGLESQCVNGEDVVRQYNIVTGKIENMGYRTALFCNEGGGSCKYLCAKDKARCDGQVAAYPYAVAAACILISGGRRGGGVGFAAGVACSAVTASIDSSKLPAACQYAYRKCIGRCDGCEK